MKSYCFIIIGLIVVDVLGKNKEFNCNQRLYLSTNDIKNCCQIPSVRLAKYRDQCYNTTLIGGFNQKHNDDFLSLMNPCSIECVYTRAGILDKEQFNMPKMNDLLNSNLPNNPELVSVLHDGIEQCYPLIQKRMEELKEIQALLSKNQRKVYQMLKAHCSPFAVMVTFCALRHAFLNCPASAWTNSDVCENARTYVNKCEPVTLNKLRTRGQDGRKRNTNSSKTKS